jgi:hypothetical protein
MSALSVTPAYACNFATCSDVVIFVCGSETFVGGSDNGNAYDIAWGKARRAGYNPNTCDVRYR